MPCSENLNDTGSDTDDAGNESCSDEEKELENISNGDSNEEKELQDGSITDNTVEKPEKTGKENENVIVQRRKIGPQKQKKEIHSCLKKAKKFEIRKLTRRITMLRNLKGTDEQKAKNNRKVDKLLLEIQAMKEFMIDEITERVIGIFKGKCEQMYLDIWNAAQDQKDFEKMLQTLSNGNDANKYEDIAFLRMINSKDILPKLQMVSSGTNIKKAKSRKALQKQLRKYNQKTKKLRKLGGSTGDNKVSAATPDKFTKATADKVSSETTDKVSEEATDKVSTEAPGDIPMETGDDTVKSAKVLKSSKSEQKPKRKAKVKKSKQSVDSFFLPADTNASDNEDVSSDEEFAAPIDNAKVTKKKNRMGQRQRKKVMEREHVKTMTDKSKGRHGSKQRLSLSQHKRTKPFEVTKKIVDDEKLHPSWKAKQKLKSQQGITEFSGTKITFEDD